MRGDYVAMYAVVMKRAVAALLYRHNAHTASSSYASLSMHRLWQLGSKLLSSQQ